MERLDLANKNMKKFGFTMAIACAVFTVLVALRHRHSLIPTSTLSVLFFLFAVLAPSALRPLYIVWMKMAFVLSWINTRLILIILFYLVFTPIGLCIKLLGKDLLERKIQKESLSYWKKKEPVADRYERQF